VGFSVRFTEDKVLRGKYGAWCGTYFQKDQADALEYVKRMKSLQFITYLIIGEEVCPTTQRKHLHIYLELSTRQTMDALKRGMSYYDLEKDVDVPDNTHWEARLGEPSEAAAYCIKDGQLVCEVGTRKPDRQQGKRTDLEAVARMALEGRSFYDISVEHPTSVIKFAKGIQALLNVTIKPREEKGYVWYIYGDTGVGKTRSVWEKEQDLLFIKHDEDLDWWDMYDPRRHKAVLIDEFKGMKKPVYYNRLLDHYPCVLQIKGGYVQFKPDRIYICSNYSIEQVANMAIWTDQEVAQFKRRIDKVIHVSKQPGQDWVDVFDSDGRNDPVAQTLEME